MPIKSRQVTVGTTATLLTTQTLHWTNVAVQAPSGAVMYVGGSDVTTTNGFPVAAGASMAFDLEGEDIYAVVATGTGTAYVIERGV